MLFQTKKEFKSPADTPLWTMSALGSPALIKQLKAVRPPLAAVISFSYCVLKKREREDVDTITESKQRSCSTKTGMFEEGSVDVIVPLGEQS